MSKKEANRFEFFIQDGKNFDLDSLFRYRAKSHFKTDGVKDKLLDKKDYKAIEKQGDYWVYVFEDKRKPEIITDVYTGTSRIEKKVNGKNTCKYVTTRDKRFKVIEEEVLKNKRCGDKGYICDYDKGKCVKNPKYTGKPNDNSCVQFSHFKNPEDKPCGRSSKAKTKKKKKKPVEKNKKKTVAKTKKKKPVAKKEKKKPVAKKEKKKPVAKKEKKKPVPKKKSPTPVQKEAINTEVEKYVDEMMDDFTLQLTNAERKIQEKELSPISIETPSLTPTPTPEIEIEETNIKKLKKMLKETTDIVQINKINQKISKVISEQNIREIQKDKNKKHITSLYPSYDDIEFIEKITAKKEFNEAKYDKASKDDYNNIEKLTNDLCKERLFELEPHQKFVQNFLSFQTPYNSLLLFHGLGTGKTCSAITVCEETRTQLKQLGINKKIIFVAAPNIQDNFKLQLFDERKLKLVNGFWDLKSCVGNKFIKEINPMNMKGLDKATVTKQIKKIISQSYEFYGYIEFSKYINKVMTKVGNLSNTSSNQFKKQLFYLQKEFQDRLIVIDEVHNIRQVDDNTSKATTKNFMNLVTYAKNIRLLLLSATPMFDSPREIVWITNLLNLVDKKYPLSEREIFDKNDNLLVKKFQNVGRKKLIRKLRGYVSFVHGENIFTFPYRIYPNMLKDSNSLLHKLKNKWSYPKKQINDTDISIDDTIKHTDLYLVDLPDIQQQYYTKIIESFKKSKQYGNFFKQQGLPFYLLDKLIHCLTFIYPQKGLDLDNLNVDDANLLFGRKGLSRTMYFNGSLNKIAKSVKYKEKTLKDHGRLFQLSNLKKYSGKLFNICDKVRKSDGIVIIYSRFIYAGAIPIALSLEEMGFTRYGRPPLFNKTDAQPVDYRMRTKSPNDKNFHQASYVIISGEKGLSPNNKLDMKAVTDSDNTNGEKVKVVIISKAGSEGLDFKNVRQIHILDPWYNLNRNEQIIGRGVRNQSHCALPFKKRNVEIYMYGSLLKDKESNNEPVDLQVYRIAERKAKKIGVITRLLKENAVDCLLNSGQTNVSEEQINKKIKQTVSSKKEIDFQLGDKKYSPICDFMDCNYKCNVDSKSDSIEKIKVDTSTYNDSFIELSISQIYQRIRDLFKEKYVYDKQELINSINVVKNYSDEQIMVALDNLINDKTEYLSDMNDNLGHLVNVGNFYMFNPIEFSGKNISTYQRSKNKNLKNKGITIMLPDKIKESITPSKVNITAMEKTVNKITYEVIVKELTEKFEIIKNLHLITKSNKKQFIYLAGWAIKNLHEYNNIPKATLQDYAFVHLVDVLPYEKKIILANHIYNKKNKPGEKDKLIKKALDKYMHKKDGMIAMILPKYNHVSMGNKHIIFLQKIDDQFQEIVNFNTMSDTIKGLWIETIKKFKIDKKNVVTNFKIGFMYFVRDDIFYKKKHVNETGNGQKCGEGKMLKPFVLKDLNDIYTYVDNRKKYTFEKSKIKEIYGNTDFEQRLDKDNTVNINALQLCIENELMLRYLDDNNMLKGKRGFLNNIELSLSDI